MQYRRFLTYNALGGIGWVAIDEPGRLCSSAGPCPISKYMHVVVIIIIVLSCIPIAVEIYRERRKAATRF